MSVALDDDWGADTCGKLSGDKIQAIRHVLTPSLSFNYHPTSASRYGVWDTYDKVDAQGNKTTVDYNRYQGMVYGAPGQGMAGSMSLTLSNNLEMKVKLHDDSTGFKKVSLIDDLRQPCRTTLPPRSVRGVT